MKKLQSKYATNRLERAALRWLNSKGQHYENGAAGAYKDLAYGGCQSGMVSELIYYTDTVKFYKRHRADIHALLKDMLSDVGGSPAELFGDKWDQGDPLASDIYNQNLLAWFGFEEAARNVAARAGIEV